MISDMQNNAIWEIIETTETIAKVRKNLSTRKHWIPGLSNINR